METGIATTTAGSNGSLASVGTAAKAFALSHPMGMAVAGGALLGVASYYALGKVFKKKEAAAPAQAEATTAAA